MAPRGRPPKPLERSQALAKGDGIGTRGRQVELAPTAIVAPSRDIPESPIELGPSGQARWESIWTAGYWLRPDQDSPWIEQICQAYDDMEAFRAQIREMGLIVKGYNGQEAANPLIKEVRALEATIRTCLSALGFSPTDRARLNLTEVQAASKLQEMQEKSSRGSTPARVHSASDQDAIGW